MKKIAIILKKASLYNWEIFHMAFDPPLEGRDELLLCYNNKIKKLDLHEVEDFDFARNRFNTTVELKRVNNTELNFFGYQIIGSSKEI